MNKQDTTVYLAADHRGVGLKLYLYEMLMADGYRVVDLGTNDLNTPVDFPDIAEKLADKMLDDTQSRGILICGTGAGVMIAASVWSLLIPSMEMSADRGKLAFIPAAVGFSLGMVFLLILDKVLSF